MSQPDPAAEALAELDALEAAGRVGLRRGEVGRRGRVGPGRVPRAQAGPDQIGAGAAEDARPAAKRAYGQRFNAVKDALEAAHEAAKSRVERPAAVSSGLDVTLPGTRPKLGHRHPLTQTADELIDIFGRFGFAVARGPEVEDVRHNFDALNIPPVHPARDPLDNFYLADGTMLR